MAARGTHAPNDAQGAEDDILASLQTPWNTGTGLTLTTVTARVILDQRQAGAVAEIDSDNLTGRLEEQRVRRLRERLDGGDHAFVLEHLAQHPGDTGSILQMLSATKERNEQTRLALFDRLVAAGFVQDADIGSLRDLVLGGPSMTALPSSADYHQAPSTITPIAPGTATPARSLPPSVPPRASARPSWPDKDTAYQPGPEPAIAEDQVSTAARESADSASDNAALEIIRKRPRPAASRRTPSPITTDDQKRQPIYAALALAALAVLVFVVSRTSLPSFTVAIAVVVGVVVAAALMGVRIASPSTPGVGFRQGEPEPQQRMGHLHIAQSLMGSRGQPGTRTGNRRWDHRSVARRPTRSHS